MGETALLTTTSAPRLVFGAHKTYHLREQWLTKGLLAVHAAANDEEAARVFTHPHASDTFGLGPGMVRALRFWMKATGLLQERREHGRSLSALTPFGTLVLRHDPHLERLGSVWLLHVHLARNRVLAPTWYWFFQRYQGRARFTRREAVEALLPWAIAQASARVVREQALRQDLACLLRMYVPERLPRSPEEEVLTISPFQRLGILRYLPDQPGRSGCYGCQAPQTEEVPPLVFLTALLLHAGAGACLPFAEVLGAPGSAGRTLLLPADVVLDLLACLRRDFPAWCPTWNTAQICLPETSASQVMQHYYTSH